MTDQNGEQKNPPARPSSLSFGALLRTYRRDRELRQEELAEQAGISVYTISNLERGVAQAPHKDTVELLARALGLCAADETAFLAAARHGSALQDRRRKSALTRAALPLPLPLTPLIGRERELGDLLARLERPEARLVTLVGLGGVGKTRLALAAVHGLVQALPARVTWISLAALRDPALVLGAIAEAVGARETPTRPLAASVRDALADPARLLALDNFEHLLPAGPALTALLEDCPQLRLLVTSRAPLSVRGEQVVDVRPLPTPALLPAPRPVQAHRAQRSPDPPGGDAAREQAVLASPAVALFLTCARATRSDLELDGHTLEQIATICHRLDGLPLAIELAAATARTVDPAELLARLEHLLDVLGGSLRDLPERQQSLRATLAWSYALLPPSSQALFRLLGVCAGGCPIAAAQTLLVESATMADARSVTADPAGASDERAIDDHVVWEALEPMLAHQLAWREPVGGARSTAADDAMPTQEPGGGEARIVVLETVRAFAAERLRAAGEEAASRAAHARYFLRLAEAAAVDLKGADQPAGLARLDQERANLYAALGWCVEAGEAMMGMRLAGALGLYWELRSLIGEGRAWFERVLAVADAQRMPQDAPHEAEDAAGMEWRSLRARACNGAGSLAMWQGDYVAAEGWLEEALAMRRAIGDERAIAASLNNLGGLALLQGEYRRSRALWRETLALRERQGEPRGVALAQLNCGIIAHKQGRSRQACTLLTRAERAFDALGDQAMRALALAGAGEALRQRGDVADAEKALALGLDLARSANRVNAIILALARLAELARLRGATEDGLRLCEEALTLAEDHEELRDVAHLYLLEAGLWLEGDEVGRARDCLDQSHLLSDQLGFRQGSADVALWRGRLAVATHDWTAAQEHYWVSLALRHALGTVAGSPECLEGLAETVAEEQEGEEIVPWLCLVAQRARDGALALRSPREQRAFTPLAERAHRVSALAPHEAIGTEDLLAPAVSARVLSPASQATIRGVLADLSTVLPQP